ncbi:MAG: CDP-archaeol synthase [Spirochaetaceae bacterium]|nr:CDP-archaeol synthase [Spirochaetaceae bacterium]
MNKITRRLLTFFIGVPLVLFIVCFTPLNHILLHLCIVVFAGISSSEIYNLMKKNMPMQSKGLVVGFATLIPVSAYGCIFFNLDFDISTLVFIAGFLTLLVVEIFKPRSENPEEPFKDSNNKLAGSLFVLLYGGYLLSYLSRMTVLPHSTEFIILFLLMVFLCDSAAWFFGVLFGKGNRGLVKASPNKSIVGFFGGIVGSIVSGILCTFVWPEIFSEPLWKMVVLGFVMALAAILGDLAESVFKRSAKEKDSGNIIPGRGGALDSVDSVLMSAPLFYFIVTMLFVEI